MGHRVVVEQGIEEHLPTLLELDLAADLVEDVDAGWQTGLDGMLAQQTLREGMEGADGGAVELEQRSAARSRRWGSSTAGCRGRSLRNAAGRGLEVRRRLSR